MNCFPQWTQESCITSDSLSDCPRSVCILSASRLQSKLRQLLGPATRWVGGCGGVFDATVASGKRAYFIASTIVAVAESSTLLQVNKPISSPARSWLGRGLRRHSCFQLMPGRGFADSAPATVRHPRLPHTLRTDVVYAGRPASEASSTRQIH